MPAGVVAPLAAAKRHAPPEESQIAGVVVNRAHLAHDLALGAGDLSVGSHQVRQLEQAVDPKLHLDFANRVR